ncbi:MAG TPA: glycosyltransferase family 39 protein [Thermoanaerobaculaceae bacterium]|nr:glycosyltransferase family 39 protein [Thermoanaerobaculaceae bacterium]HRS16887.1 glycosyltransferase family 39 protein [Thermoanaerobaculaceae bacterium]
MTTASSEARTRERVALACVAALAALQLAWLLPSVPLLEPDEGRYLDIPRHMVESGDWVTPRLNGVLYFEKPPLHYWLTAAAIEAIGLTETAVRIWNVLFALLGVVIAWGLARSWGGREAGLGAVLVLGTAPLWIGLGRLGSLDMAVSLFITATLGGAWLASRAADRRRERWLWWGAFASAAAAVMTKGLIGVVLPAAVTGAWVVATRQWRLLRRVPWVSGSALFLALAAPWHLLASLRNPDFAWFYFVHEHVLRYVTPIAERQEPWWFFIAVVAAGMLPWTGLLPAALRVAPGARRWRQLADHSDGLFFALWFAVVFLFFSASQSKLIPYMGPALPPLAVLAGRNLASRWSDVDTSRSARLVWGAGLALLAGLGAILVVAGLGRIDRLGLGGRCTLWLVVAGAAAAGLAIAGSLAGWRARWRHAAWFAAAAAVVVNLAVGGLAVRLGEERSSKGVAEALHPRLRADEPVFAYRDFQESLAPYLGRQVGVVGAVGELAFGAARLSPAVRVERFPTVEEFRPRWDSAQRVWLSVGRNWRRKMAADGLGHVEVVWEGRERALVTNLPLEAPEGSGRAAAAGAGPPGAERR